MNFKELKLVMLVTSVVLLFLGTIAIALYYEYQQTNDADAVDSIVKAVAKLPGNPPTLLGANSALTQKLVGTENITSSWSIESDLGADWRASESGIHWTATWDGTRRVAIFVGLRDSFCKAITQKMLNGPRLEQFSIGAAGANVYTAAVNLNTIEQSQLAAAISDLADVRCVNGANNQLAFIMY